MTVTPTQPIVGEQTRFNGKVSTKKKRKIYLERRVGTKWQVVKKAKTTKRGTWSMTIPWRWSASTMRVRLPKKGKSKQLISASRVITPAKQSGLVVMPTWFEVGEKIVVTARFAPARSGRPVWLQARSGSSWITVAKGVQNRSGLTSFTRSTSTKQVATYRAVTTAAKGAPTHASPSVRAVAGVRIPLERPMALGRGSTQAVDLSPDLAAVVKFKTTVTPPAGARFAFNETSGISVSAEMAAVAKDFVLRGDGVGCLGGTCDIGFRLTVTLTVTDPVPAVSGTEQFTAASPDRVAAAVPNELGTKALQDEVLVTLGTPESPGKLTDAQAVANTVGATVTGGIEDIGFYEFRWLQDPPDINAALQSIRSAPGVAGAKQSLLDEFRETAINPDDWTGDGRSERWGLIDIDAPQAWETTKGSDVPVGIVDGGTVWDGHEDLNVVNSFNNTSPDSKGSQHATHVAGLACARKNGKGIVGAAWGCPIFSASGTDANGNINAKSEIVSARMLAKKFGESSAPRVINISLGVKVDWIPDGSCATKQQSDRLRSLIEKVNGEGSPSEFRALFAGVGKNVVWTLSAGNMCRDGLSSDAGYTSWRLPNVITVASFNSDKKLSSFSNFGEGVEVAAPGGVGLQSDGITGGAEGVLSASRRCDPVLRFLCSSKYRPDYGTSQAAPIVAGVAALAISANPDRTAAEIGECIVSTAGAHTGRVTQRSAYPSMRVPPSIPFPAAVPMVSSIPIVDADAAVECAKGDRPPSPPPPPGPKVSARVGMPTQKLLIGDSWNVTSTAWTRGLPGATISEPGPTFPLTVQFTPPASGTYPYGIRVNFTNGTSQDFSGTFDGIPVPAKSIAARNLETSFEPGSCSFSLNCSHVSFQLTKTTTSDSTPADFLSTRENPAEDQFSYSSGDLNNNRELDTNEAWTYQGILNWSHFPEFDVDCENGDESCTRTIMVSANDNSGAQPWVEIELRVVATRE